MKDFPKKITKNQFTNHNKENKHATLRKKQLPDRRIRSE